MNPTKQVLVSKSKVQETISCKGTDSKIHLLIILNFGISFYWTKQLLFQWYRLQCCVALCQVVCIDWQHKATDSKFCCCEYYKSILLGLELVLWILTIWGGPGQMWSQIRHNLRPNFAKNMQITHKLRNKYAQITNYADITQQ